MLGSAASNATLVKTRMKYARMLTSAQYRELMDCPGISEIASTLSSVPPFDHLLADARESVLHRGNLEILLRRAAYQEMLLLCRFDSSIGNHYFEYIVRQGEIRQLYIFLRFFGAGHPEEFALAISEFFVRHSKIDLERLPECRSFDQILDALSGSPLRDVVASFRPKEGENMDFSMLESALQKHLFSFLFSLIDRDFGGATADELHALYGVHADLKNIQLVSREVQYFQPSPSIIRSQLIPYGQYLSKGQRDALCECRTREELSELIAHTRYGRELHLADGLLDRQCDRLLYRQAKKNMSFSSHPAVVLASYWMLAQLQLEDLTTIIEGVRYHIPPEEFARFLIVDLNSKAGETDVY